MTFVISTGKTIYGPYGDLDCAERAAAELAAQGAESVVLPLTNGLLVYRDMQDAPRDSFNDWTDGLISPLRPFLP